mgnify:CR=1 FL=1
MSDSVDHPEHYDPSGIEAIDVIEAWKLNFHLGNVIKYICRYQHKKDINFTCNVKCDDKSLEDLKKARWYLDRKIEWMEKNSSQ